MSRETELLHSALDVLTANPAYGKRRGAGAAIDNALISNLVDDIRANLAEPLTEPAGVVRAINPIARTAEFNFNTDLNGNISEWLKVGAKVYAEPIERSPLTDDDIRQLAIKFESIMQFARAIEKAHGIKEQE
jgi:hypothetical protein